MTETRWKPWVGVVVWLIMAVLPGVAQEEERGVSRTVNLDASESGDDLGYSARHALIIGIDDYEDPAFPDLGYAAADARGKPIA